MYFVSFKRIHICVTYLHTKSGVAEKLVKDVEEITFELMKDPAKPVEGAMALYGTAQEIPDRSIVEEFTKIYLDKLCYTPKASLKASKV